MRASAGELPLRRAVRLAAVAASLLMAACGSSRQNESLAAPDPVWDMVSDIPAVDSSFLAPVVVSSDGAGHTLRIGPNDLLAVSVLEAPELDREVRVDGTGRISLPLLGEIAAAGLTTRELELRIQDSLSARYIRDPHVSVRVSEMEGRAVSVVGAVVRPGVFQIREPRPLLELIALAGGFAPDAGETVIVVRARSSRPAANGTDRMNGQGESGDGAAGAAGVALTVNLRALLESGGPNDNVYVQPGDQVKVSKAGIAYVVGEVQQPGAFPINGSAGLTVLRAIALAQGFGSRAAKGRTVIIRTGEDGERRQVPVDVGDILSGKAPDVELEAQDVVFVPSSTARVVSYGVVDALVRMVSLRNIF